MFQIAICDDNAPTTSEMEQLLNIIGQKDNISLNIDIFFDGLSLCRVIESGQIYDLIYLDIEMEKVDGIQTAHLIRKYRLPTLIIYISAYDNYFKQLFEVEPFRFLSKPIDRHLFYQYFQAASIRLKKQKLFFTFHFNRITTKVLVSDIIFIESVKRYIIILHHQGINMEIQLLAHRQVIGQYHRIQVVETHYIFHIEVYGILAMDIGW